MKNVGKRSILYIVNFYGSPPLNYFEKYLNENKSTYLTIIKLPAVRPSKNRINIDAFIKDEKGNKHNIDLNLFFPLPNFLVFMVQYVLNFFILFILLSKIKRKKFNIIIGETNFGGANAYILKKIGRCDFSIYFNGDILPDTQSSNKCFFLPNNESFFSPFFKFIDSMLIMTQYLLRKMGYGNDLIWFGDKKIEEWDSKKGLEAHNKIIFHGILIDYKEYEKYNSVKKNMNDICYLGRIDDYVGFDILIPSLALIKKILPGIRMHVIGGSVVGIEKYRNLAKQNNVEDNIKFYGYVPKMEDAYNIMSHCALGLALYKPVKDNVSMYTNPGKPKEYIKVGLPVLLTKGGPEIGQEIAKYNAGVEVDFDKEKVTDAIIKIISDNNIYVKLQSGVKRYALKEDINIHFKEFFKNLEKLLIKH
ncbi:MAG: glycosyltransferase [Candidatus Roizmanbacteria bacterium]|nr:MAG: glycosyltransferase [Candidatus Roizmanbacteria bacterium]